jgi:beta-glucosidase/6-phospho-beta-glucosidase/beta-galactosidase
MAHELAVEAILSETPDAIIVQAESMERFTPAGRDAGPLADEWNALRFVPLDLTLGHALAPRMAAFLADHGVSTNDLAFFRERRGVGRRWIGLDYYSTCEHRVYSSGRLAVDRRPVGFASIAREYWERYRVPLFHCETHHGSDRAVPWLHAQWREVLSLLRAGVPVTGFTWFSLTDQFDWHLALRELRNEVYPVGLADLDRRPRPVGDAYRDLIAAWASRIDRGDIADEPQRATA